MQSVYFSGLRVVPLCYLNYYIVLCRVTKQVLGSFPGSISDICIPCSHIHRLTLIACLSWEESKVSSRQTWVGTCYPQSSISMHDGPEEHLPLLFIPSERLRLAKMI